MRRGRAIAAGLALGTVVDAIVGDPRRGHPVALFGTAAAALERRSYADNRARGLLHVAACLLPTVAAATLSRRRREVAVVAAATWSVLGARSLGTEAGAVREHLERDDLPAARERLTHLVGRDPSRLDAPEISRAVVESVAENTCDAVVAPLLWGAVFGAPGLVGYRVVNTLDAMIGHRSPRYERFGWAAARLDDVANYLPARATALFAAVSAPLVGGSPRRTLDAARRWGRQHPSPNSGMSEAAFAGALGVRLGGRNVYANRVEHRPVLGDGRAVDAHDVPQATRLLHGVTACAATASVVIALVLRGRG